MTMDANALFVFEQRSGIPVLSLRGEINWTNVDRVRSSLAHLEAASEGRDAVLDLAHVPLALSSLFGNIEALAGRMLAGHRKRVVVSPPDCFASQILRLLRYPYAVTQTLEGAIAALSTRGLGSREG